MTTSFSLNTPEPISAAAQGSDSGSEVRRFLIDILEGDGSADTTSVATQADIPLCSGNHGLDIRAAAAPMQPLYMSRLGVQAQCQLSATISQWPCNMSLQLDPTPTYLELAPVYERSTNPQLLAPHAFSNNNLTEMESWRSCDNKAGSSDNEDNKENGNNRTKPHKSSSSSSGSAYKPTMPEWVKTELICWFNAHWQHPYPDATEKYQLCEKYNMTTRKLNNW
jgi:Homeobox KN domain